MFALLAGVPSAHAISHAHERDDSTGVYYKFNRIHRVTARRGLTLITPNIGRGVQKIHQRSAGDKDARIGACRTRGNQFSEGAPAVLGSARALACGFRCPRRNEFCTQRTRLGKSAMTRASSPAHEASVRIRSGQAVHSPETRHRNFLRKTRTGYKLVGQWARSRVQIIAGALLSRHSFPRRFSGPSC